MSQQTAEAVFQELRKLPSTERDKFFTMLGRQISQDESFSHDEVFSDVIGADFSSEQAAEYLDVSMSTFRRYVRDGKVRATSEMGRNQLFSTASLKEFKRSLKAVKGSA